MPFFYNDPERKERRQHLRRNATRIEYYFWGFLRCRQIENTKFRRQYGVGFYILDFYCSALRLAVELDGESHYSSEAQKYDKQRTEFLQQLNIEVVRFENSEVAGNIEEVLNKLRMIIKKRREQLALPPQPSYK